MTSVIQPQPSLLHLVPAQRAVQGQDRGKADVQFACVLCGQFTDPGQGLHTPIVLLLSHLKVIF